MSCPPDNGLPYFNIVNEAFILAGVNSNGTPLAAEDLSLGISVINQVLGIWSGKSEFIYYVDEFEFPVVASQGDFRIGNGLLDEARTNPFVNIGSLNYKIGGVDYGCVYTPWKSFNLIPIKNTGGYPSNWSYQYYGDHTLLRLYPKPPVDCLIKVTGKQVLTDISLFSPTANMPGHARTALTYWAAKMLTKLARGTPAAGFDSDFKLYYDLFVSSNKQEVEYEVMPPFRSRKTAGSGNSRGGGRYM